MSTQMKQSKKRGGAKGPLSEEQPKSTQEHFQANPDSYNGAVRENYSWSQDYSNVEVRVFIPKTVLKGGQVSVCLQSNSVCVRVKDGDCEETLMEGEFTHRISTADSMWYLEPGESVQLSLSKSSEVWWSAVLKGETEINVDKIRKERALKDDDEERAVMEWLLNEQKQKREDANRD